MSLNLFSFGQLSKNNFPPKIILDTNFVLNLTHSCTSHPTSRNVSDCIDFVKSLIYDGCEIFVPQIVINEFCHQVFLNVLAEYIHKHSLKINKADLYKQRPHLITPGHSQIKNAMAMMDKIIAITELKEEGSKIRDRAIAIMEKHHFLPSDAFISAVAIENGIHSIASQDVYFAKNIAKEKGMKIFMPAELIPRR